MKKGDYNGSMTLLGAGFSKTRSTFVLETFLPEIRKK
jgi:hypothetical protein